MDNYLKGLFDFQKFEQNSKLDAIISQTQNKYMKAQELSDDDLTMVNAAGSPEMMRAAIENLEKNDI